MNDKLTFPSSLDLQSTLSSLDLDPTPLSFLFFMGMRIVTFPLKVEEIGIIPGLSIFEAE